MQSSKNNLVIITGCYLLSIALLLPYANSFAHTFEDHNYQKWNDNNKQTLHESELVCECYDFKLTNQSTLFNSEYEFVDKIDNIQLFDEIYTFKYYHQTLYFSLRAPPTMV